MSHTQTWPVTPAQYAAMEADVNASGFPISGNFGEAEKDGVTVDWGYDGTTLSITVVSAPPFCTGLAEGQIADAVNQTLASLKPQAR